MTSESDAVTTEDRTEGQDRAGDPPDERGGAREDRRAAAPSRSGSQDGSGGAAKPGRQRALTIVSVVAVLLFSLWGIGTPLLGTTSLTPTNEMVQQSPYAEAGHAGSISTNAYLDDTYTSEFPSTILYKSALKGGLTNGQWDPYQSGGVPLAATPNYALASPLTVVYYVLPTWLAPAYERLLEVVVAVGGAFLFLRRLNLSRPAALTAGVVFAGSGFMFVWLNFPQTRVAAFIPALFWTLERYFQQRKLRDAALISIPVASMLLGGFPAVAGYAVMTAAAYGVVRLATMHRESLRAAWRPLVGSALGAAAGVGLAAFQLLPFSSFLHAWYTNGRSQTSSQHLDPTSFLTSFAPFAFGGADASSPPLFYVGTNYIEAVGYVSAGASVLALVAFALQRSGRALLPRGLWIFFTVTTLGWAELIYFGGPPLAVLQDTPIVRSVFEINFIGRARSVFGFLVAVLVGIGLELLLRHRRSNRAVRSRPGLVWAAGVGVAAAAVTGWLLVRGEHDAESKQKAIKAARRAGDLVHGAGNAITVYRHQILYSAILVLVAVICVAVVRYAASRRDTPAYDRVWGKARFAAAAVLPLLIAGQSTWMLTQYYPKSDPDTFYPVTDTHSYLAANLGGQRYAAGGNGMVFGTNVAYDLRAVNGHGFLDSSFTKLVKGIPGNPVPFATYIALADSTAVARSPVLDLLGTKYFVTALSDQVLGPETPAATDGSSLTLQPGQSVTEPVPATGRLRGVGVTPQGRLSKALTAPDPDSWVEVTVKDAAGAQVARSKRLTSGIKDTDPWVVPVAADSVAAGTHLTATVTLHAKSPLTVAADNGAPALTTVAGADDGLKLVHVGTSAIYQRLNAQPRIRWASSSEVVGAWNERMQLLATGQVGADSVILSKPGPAASGQPATVDVTKDGLDTISTTVDAQGSGYLVVADADQVGWSASVDGHKAALVPADQGVVAVNVPAGKHTVTLNFAAPHGTIAYAATIATAVVLVGVVVGEVWWMRRRHGKGGAGAEPVEPATASAES